MKQITLEVAEAALREGLAEGCTLEATLQFAAAHRADDVRSLALASVPPGVDRVLALRQIAGWQTAVAKLPLWAATDGIVFPVRLSMEQCSSEEAAAAKAALVVGDSLVDLTGGLGVDFSWMARHVARATYVERDAPLAVLARHNFSALGLEHVTVVHGTAEEVAASLTGPVGTVYLDPARRDGTGQKVFAVSDCTPDASALAPRLLALARRVIVKLSPMLDVSAVLRGLPSVSELHVVAVGGECKELLAVMDRGHSGPALVICRDGGRRYRYRTDEPVEAVAVWDGTASEGMTLCEPDATIMKAGCHDRVARWWGLTPVAANSHLLLKADGAVADDFPGRTFAVRSVTTMGKRELREALRGIDRANVAVRNFPMSARELQRRLRLRDGGETYIFGTTTASGRHVLFITARV